MKKSNPEWEHAWNATYNAALTGLYTNVSLVASKEGVEKAHELAKRAADLAHGKSWD